MVYRTSKVQQARQVEALEQTLRLELLDRRLGVLRRMHSEHHALTAMVTASHPINILMDDALIQRLLGVLDEARLLYPTLEERFSSLNATIYEKSLSEFDRFELAEVLAELYDRMLFASNPNII